jgi:hypothetical protein
MQNQAPQSPARVLYEELRETEDAGLLDTWPAHRESDDQAPANDRAPAGDAHPAVAGDLPGPEDIPELSPEGATLRSSATSYGDKDRIRIERTRDSGSIDSETPVDNNNVERIHAVEGIADGDAIQPRSALAAIIRLQSTEIERLAQENDRLAVRLDAVEQRHENEQNQRRELEQRLHEARARNQPPAPVFDAEEIRRAAREGMSAEIKPVLMAILDLLESALPRGAEAATSAATAVEAETVAPAATPLSAPAGLVAEVMSDCQRLPEILTRPLEELTRGSGNADAAPQPIEHLPPPIPPGEPRARRPRPPRYEAQPSPMPGVFAWTSVFS